MFLSASRIKTYLTCSWTYYCTYVLGFRHLDEGNDGSKRGTICHLVLECIQNPKRHYLIEKFQKGGYAGNQNIHRLVLKHAKILGVDDAENMSMMEGFIKIGLKTDFLCEGWDLQDPEMKFSIENESPQYKVLGFIDKHAISKDSESIRIDDYKTSKIKFTGKDKDFNIQALMYSLALMKQGQYKKAFVNFVFLKFPKSPLQSFEFNKELISGFEIYLGNVYRYLSNFSVKKAKQNFAKHNDSYFLCGKEKGDINAKGLPAWVCPWKRSFLYYEVRDSRGKIKFTAKDKQKALDKTESSDTILEKWYPGCPAWNKYSK